MMFKTVSREKSSAPTLAGFDLRCAMGIELAVTARRWDSEAAVTCRTDQLPSFRALGAFHACRATAHLIPSKLSAGKLRTIGGYYACSHNTQGRTERS